MPEVITNNKKEQEIIEAAYQDMLHSIKSELIGKDEEYIRGAYELAVEAHREQRRKSGEPYVLHPIAVAKICSEEIGLGPTAITAAILHDVVEDTDVTLEEIYQRFGERIGKMVDGLTKLDSAYTAESPQAENFKKVLMTLLDDVRIVLIKMADRLHNMRTIDSMPRHKQLKIAAETSYVYAPLAHRLGLFAFKSEFEDLCFKVRDYDTYKDISKKLADKKKIRNEYINGFITPLEEELKKANIPARIIGRPKTIYSIYRKMIDKEVPFEEVYDLFAIRIILDVPKEQEKEYCWKVYSIITNKYRPVVERLRDWISNPKSNGYESLHTTILGPQGRYVEVQIRSERMDEIAEKGVAAHWKYKNILGVSTSSEDIFDQWLNQVRELLASDESDPVLFLDDFKTNLFSEEVQTYTPKGELKVFPKGATVLDFAYSIHTEIGNNCVAAKVHERIVPLHYVLRSGDQVRILTKSTQSPSEGWLKMVATAKARSAIRGALRDIRKKMASIGEEYLTRKLKSLGVTKIRESIELLSHHYKYSEVSELFVAIEREEIDLKQFNHYGISNEGIIQIPQAKQPDPKAPDRVVTPRTAVDPSQLKLKINGENAENYHYTLSSCCNPLPGDEIFGYISTKAIISIHRYDCPNAKNILSNYNYRVLPTSWGTVTESKFISELLITGVDDIGIVQKLTDIITTELGINIRSISMTGDNGFFEGKIKIIVSYKDQVNLAIKKIKTVEGISNVRRIS